MIINHSHRFAFIHIPKCAGTSVRKVLQEFDDLDGRHTSRVDIHPKLGNLDYVHIPLFILKEFFPAEFTQVESYWSFAVVRDPFKRFGSSVSQRLKMYSNKPIHKCEEKDIKAAIHESIDFLKRTESDKELLPPEFIHFQRQIDFIELDGKRVIDTLFTVDNIGVLLKEFEQRIGKPLENNSGRTSSGPHANSSLVFRNNLFQWLIESTRPLTNGLVKALPQNLKEKARKTVYVPQDKRMNSLFSSDYVLDFIKDFYAEDISLYRQLMKQKKV
ncbi:sulfotransferase family 2 domain-containing protein [Idiomarina seosinensis]|uniref:Sulfotransferase family protein n=1 Tax=Idiomarina seosinensis TaxID=281739 RepID=A0A432ZG89_9GAMM|nr:sulfotransferase family 2 domain-containing protein [Idiomarina seosinensis]RUO76951.1 hypothetical protein CWI81_00120 [Idiomarina seosinensis]